MGKPLIIFMFGVTLYITLSSWYKQGNSGAPDPSVIAPAAWLFGILALTADFLEGLPVILAVALTFILWTRTQASTAPTKKPANQHMSVGKR